jgi:diacylglycerol kinase (CTP)
MSTTATFSRSLSDLLGFVANANSYNQQPTTEHLFKCLGILTTLSMVWYVYVAQKGHGGIRSLARYCGVRLKRIRSVANEIERKSFHLSGLFVPLLWQYTTHNGMSRDTQVSIAVGICVFGCTSDLLRVYIPFVQKHWPLKKILRAHEDNQLCGASYFACGCTITLICFPSSVAIASIVWLVMGDLSAALIGRSFGGDAVAVKLGRTGKKSLEGSFAMFFICVVVGMIMFKEVPLREYAVILGALVATMTELFEPFGVNDNLTIPIFSALSLHYGLLRVGGLCENA